ncbi:MAG: 50S ribosomal protein L17 [Elusimicrobiaceae bacterium]
MIKNLGHRKLSKTGSHRKAMFCNMATSLFLHEEIKTTVPKAKELRRVVDRVITQARAGDTIGVRKTVNSKLVCKKLFEVIAPRYANRPGGYTRMFRLGRRAGDNTEMSLIKLVD